MSKRKKDENETPEQTRQRRIFESISNFANRSDKTAWERKIEKLQQLLEELQPLEQQILDLTVKKYPIMDKITTVRKKMLENCIHPFDNLVLYDTHVHCKFCDTKISIPHEFRQENNDI